MGRGGFLVVLASAFAFAFALVGCRERTTQPASIAVELGPVATLQAFYDALAAGDSVAAVSWMLPPEDARAAEALAASLADTIEFAVSGELVLEAKEARVEGEWALVVARHEFGGDVVVHGEVLRETADGWRVVAGVGAGEEGDGVGEVEALMAWLEEERGELERRYR